MLSPYPVYVSMNKSEKLHLAIRNNHPNNFVVFDFNAIPKYTFSFAHFSGEKWHPLKWPLFRCDLSFSLN